MTKLYAILTILLAPIIRLYLQYRLYKGKEDAGRFRERLGYASKPRPAGKLTWFHCASVGESISVLPLIERLSDTNILITSGTVTSAKLLEKEIAKRDGKTIIHQYVPVDTIFAVKRFLKHWQPDLAVWVESELWPNLVLQTKCPMLLLNGRMSEKSYQKWRKMRPFIKSLLGKFTLVLPQTEHEKFAELGAKNVRYIGNLKYTAPPLSYDEKELAKLQTQIGDKKIWVAASTHKGEEEIIKQTHEFIRKSYSDTLTIIIPRHPNRRNEIMAIFPDAGLRSENSSIKSDVYIADTMGELGLFYSLSDIAFVGGSLIPHGGHNPLEPAKLHCAVITGKYVHNFNEIYAELGDAVMYADDAKQLANTVIKLWKDEEYRAGQADKAYQIAMSKMDILDKIVECLEGKL